MSLIFSKRTVVTGLITVGSELIRQPYVTSSILSEVIGLTTMKVPVFQDQGF